MSPSGLMQQHLRLTNGWLVFLFSALAVTAPAGNGYAYAPVVLILLSLAFCVPAVRKPLALSLQDKSIIAIMVFFVLAHAIEIVLDDQALRAIDRPSRFLLAVPVLLLLLAYPPKPAFFWWGAVAGSAIAGVIMILYTWLFGSYAARHWMMPIQFAALVSVLAWISFAGMGYFQAMRNLPGMVAGAAGGLLGLTAAVLSGTRGAWLAIPFALLVLALSYRKVFPLRVWTGIILALLLTLVTLVGMSQTSVRDEMMQARSDIQHYFENGEVETSPGVRLEMWKIALDMIPEHPWLGWGRNGYVGELTRRVASGETSDDLLRFTHTHSELIDAQTKRGLLGLLALLALYIVPARWFMQRALSAPDLKIRAAGLAGVFLTLVFFFSGLTQTLFAHNSGATFYAFMLVIAWSNMRALEHASTVHYREAPR